MKKEEENTHTHMEQHMKKKENTNPVHVTDFDAKEEI